jgi:hypothetical protein
MQIETSGSNELTISGNIKSIDDGKEIKDAVNTLISGGATTLNLKIQESFSMTSTVIGFLMKLVNIDQIRVSLVVGDQRLYQLLEDLCLIQAFNVHRLGK